MLAAVVEGLRLRILVEVMPEEAVAKTLGGDAPVLSSQALVKVRVAWSRLTDLDVSAAWNWNGAESVGTVCPVQAHALERSGFVLVLVPADRSGQPVRLSVDVEVDARLCETPPCRSLRLVASMDVAASVLAVSPQIERLFARERVVVQP